MSRKSEQESFTVQSEEEHIFDRKYVHMLHLQGTPRKLFSVVQTFEVSAWFVPRKVFVFGLWRTWMFI